MKDHPSGGPRRELELAFACLIEVPDGAAQLQYPITAKSSHARFRSTQYTERSHL